MLILFRLLFVPTPSLSLVFTLLPTPIPVVFCIRGALTLILQQISAFPDHLNTRDKRGRTPLMYACQWGHYHICASLLDHGAHLNLVDHEGRRALYWSYASMGANIRVVELLLERGADLNEPWMSPLFFSSISRQRNKQRRRRRGWIDGMREEAVVGRHGGVDRVDEGEEDAAGKAEWLDTDREYGFQGGGGTVLMHS